MFTYKPEINNRRSKSRSDIKSSEEYSKLLTKHDPKKLELKTKNEAEMIQNETKECSFTPKVNQRKLSKYRQSVELKLPKDKK